MKSKKIGLLFLIICPQMALASDVVKKIGQTFFEIGYQSKAAGHILLRCAQNAKYAPAWGR